VALIPWWGEAFRLGSALRFELDTLCREGVTRALADRSPPYTDRASPHVVGLSLRRDVTVEERGELAAPARAAEKGTNTRGRYSIRGKPWKRTRVQVVAAAWIVTVIGVPPVVWAWGRGVSR
jgi:hypothetical protein